jgi:hypothetical protein
MITVHRAHGFRFVIFPNDHSPPHVHVFGHGGEAKIVLEGTGAVRLDWVVGIGRGDLARVMQEARCGRARARPAGRDVEEDT